jgi:diketogulonate reductase-like aldo/keto reductase
VSNKAVVLRWITQSGIPLVTASGKKEFDIADMDIFLFNLSATEMAAVAAYPKGDL